EPVARVPLPEPQQEAGGAEQERERRREGGVQLLPRVEPPLRRGPPAGEPPAVLDAEGVQLARGAGEAAAVTGERDERERREPADAGPEVHVLHRRAAADRGGEARQVEDE